MCTDELGTVDAGASFAAAIDRELGRFLAERRSELQPLGPDVAALIDSAEQFVVGGKRLRPRFCYSGWLAAGGSPADRAIVVAAASLEWLQASALIHDDLIDQSDVRRGRPSVHREFEQRHRSADAVGSTSQFGAAAAILLGDLTLSWTDQQLRASALPTIARGLDLLDLCRSEVASGQFLDVVAQTRSEVSVEAARLIVRYKSARYTVERPLQIGAALAGADDAFIAALSTVAAPLGEAFQLRDDLLGVFGDPETTGKPAGDDLREGKRTMLIARALERGSSQDRDLVQRLLGTDQGVEPLRELIIRTGARQAVEADIDARERQVSSALAALPSQAQQAIEPLIMQVTRRVR